MIKGGGERFIGQMMERLKVPKLRGREANLIHLSEQKIPA